VMDWFSRFVLSWSLSLTMEVECEVSGSVRDARQPALLSSVRCQGASDSEPQDHTTDP
jgi:hypothetical protein